MTYDTAEKRWAAAAQLAAGVADEHLSARRRKVFVRIAITIGGTWLIGVIVGIIAAIYRSSNAAERVSRSSADTGDWQLFLPLVFFVAGTIVGVIGFIWAVRTKHYIVRWKAVMSPLTKAEMKNVKRQLAGKAAVDREHLPIIVAIARQQRVATWGIAPLLAPFAFWFAAVLVGPSEAIDVLTKVLIIVAGLAMLVSVVQIAVVYRNSGRFIEKYASETPQPAVAR